ncbi:MAG: hypothetical protein ACX93O_01385 [Flagellimonas sp.]
MKKSANLTVLLFLTLMLSVKAQIGKIIYQASSSFQLENKDGKADKQFDAINEAIENNPMNF